MLTSGLTNTVRIVVKAFALLYVATSMGCKLSDITDSAQALDGTSIPPNKIESREGARWVYLGAVAKFNQYMGLQASQVARFTDESALLPIYGQSALDSRVNNNVHSGSYVVANASFTSSSQATKVQLEQAVYLLETYYDASGNAMKAHAYALLGLTYAMIADVFCSGYAISDSRWGGNFIPGGPLSKDSLYKRAVIAANKGLTIQTDSAPLTNLLKGVKARSLNSLGQYKEANDLIADFVGGFMLGETFIPATTDTTGVNFPILNLVPDRNTIINQKGSNGLKWVSDDAMQQDMRIPIRTIGGVNLIPLNTEYSYSPRRIAYFDVAEARLIEAEYFLSIGDITEFMRRINTVRRMYKVRSGAPVADTTDPQTRDGRIDLLFRERAYTFYATGRRMEDLRALTRRYGREPQSVWPVGRSEGLRDLDYGDNYVFVPEEQGLGEEASNNPNYKQCESYEP